MESNEESREKLYFKSIFFQFFLLNPVGGVVGLAEAVGFRDEMPLTEHGLQAHEAADEVVEVDGQVGLRVAGDDQLVQLFVQFIAFLGNKQTNPTHPRRMGGKFVKTEDGVNEARGSSPERGVTCRFQRHPHLVGAHAPRLIQVELAEDGLRAQHHPPPQKKWGSPMRRETPKPPFRTPKPPPDPPGSCGFCSTGC